MCSLPAALLALVLLPLVNGLVWDMGALLAARDAAHVWVQWRCGGIICQGQNRVRRRATCKLLPLLAALMLRRGMVDAVFAAGQGCLGSFGDVEARASLGKGGNHTLREG